ncbi:exosortase H-associated membrane protein [Thiolapillus sp.]|uniref:exosortase H-associated membrane protein n=5 Tax=Thiolapillus sp. TaxID=2017437 RepID=UPI0025D688BF|nr:exosortase H-associated membrane protein [Thiolapillus sp.]
MSASPVKRFVLKVILWLPLCFAVWYYMKGVIGLPTFFLVDGIMSHWLPAFIKDIEFQGHLLNVVLQFAPPPEIKVPEGQKAELVFSVNSLVYGYSIPLYTALILATPDTEKAKWIHWITGFIILVLAQSWGVSFDILKTLLFKLDPGLSSQLGFSSFQKELVALGYQFGYLILPAVTPLVLWIGFHQQFLGQLVPGIQDRFRR